MKPFKGMFNRPGVAGAVIQSPGDSCRNGNTRDAETLKNYNFNVGT